jgi:hypothetical protein
MPQDIARQFTEHIASVREQLQMVTEDISKLTICEGGWSGKEVIGHLIDSALNNHQRFVRAALDGAYEGPSYDQNGWVDLHGYSELSWSDLLAHWNEQNELVCRVVERIDQNRMGALCRVGSDSPVTLEFLIVDYLRHLDHHASQIAALKNASAK